MQNRQMKNKMDEQNRHSKIEQKKERKRERERERKEGEDEHYIQLLYIII